VEVPEILIDVALGVVSTTIAPEVLDRFASVWRVEGRYMRCFLMLSITINSLYYWNASTMLRKAIPALICHWLTLHSCEKGGLRPEKVIVIVL
jgi:hypothetical protein